jgi:hypothetical protein
MGTDEEPSGLSLSSETETGCIGALTLCIVVGIKPKEVARKSPEISTGPVREWRV